MKREVLMIVAAAAMLVIGAGAGKAADQGTVQSLSDLDTGAGHYTYIYPHAGFDNLPPTAYTQVAPVRPAPNAAPMPLRADVPIDAPRYAPTPLRSGNVEAQR